MNWIEQSKGSRRDRDPIDAVFKGWFVSVRWLPKMYSREATAMTRWVDHALIARVNRDEEANAVRGNPFVMTQGMPRIATSTIFSASKRNSPKCFVTGGLGRLATHWRMYAMSSSYCSRTLSSILSLVT